MKIGVISDTHNYLDPKVTELLAGVDHILHGGDIGEPWLLRELEAIAPTTAVSGNTDSEGSYKETQVVELGGRKFLVHHIVDVRYPSERIRGRIEKEIPDVVIFGHTHKPFQQQIGKTLYFNPGYAGKKRFELPRTLAILHLEKGEVRADYFKL
ncbi:MAG TPA: metallophosphoesterase family protein [Candidatus Saccharimonadales bacterium]|nr:metallophosphoesterase family protein [Candidatus Saccharimonadales bacterium]